MKPKTLSCILGTLALAKSEENLEFFYPDPDPDPGVVA